MIRYRTFRNVDPPGLVDVWNQAFIGRGAVRMPGCSWLEYFLLSKIYFDPESLILAEADGQIVGFVWAGFGPNDTETSLDMASGVVCLLAVAPSHRRQGIGSELMRRAESYLTARGCKELFAGPMYPLNPYTFGVYGGSSSPGFLESDPSARPFFEHHHFTIASSCTIFQYPLKRGLNIADGRFAAHRLRYEIRSNPFQGTTWWQECILGPVDLFEYRLQDKLTGRTASRALLWEMEPYTQRWNEHAVGIVEITAPSEIRRQGLAKFLMAQLLRYLQEQFFGIAEIQVLNENAAGIAFLRGLGFEPVDSGNIYRKNSSSDSLQLKCSSDEPEA